MPLPQLLALVLALGIGDYKGREPLAAGELPVRIAWLLGSLAALQVVSALAGSLLARSVRKSGREFWRRRLHLWVSRGLDLTSLLLLAWWLFGLEWPRIVAWNLGLRSTFLLDELLILTPYFVALIAIWVGMFQAERGMRGSSRAFTLRRHLMLRARQTLGVMVPLVLIYGFGRDGVRMLFPNSAEEPLVQLLGLALVGMLILLLAPAFVRLSWPTRPLEAGPLRARLERLAKRFGFRCSNILVWDTGGSVVNAGITGALPWFRYVLLTDALLAQLGPEEIEAVFGHEIGHVAHRHLAYFGFFFMGSLGMLALVDIFLRWGGSLTAPWTAALARTAVGDVLEWASALGFLGLYFLVVFGFLSRRFERQADVFGCRVVSCGREACPPHADLNAAIEVAPAPDALCPVGIQIFSNALREVANLNGLSFQAPSWRHGSIARRISFLKGLVDRPDSVRLFQTQVARLRIILALVLLAATLLAIWMNQGGS